MLFVITALDKHDSLALRLSVREAHLAYARETGRMKLGGPLLDEVGDMAGSLMIVEAPDRATVEAWHAGDPYAQAGLFASSEIRPWKPTFNPSGATF
ncbi:MAG: YciI family protein [Rhizomicrobium sp.]|nr:YciI family protein [Rhizomicrobium sp.]